jgi:hypothetical protein
MTFVVLIILSCTLKLVDQHRLSPHHTAVAIRGRGLPPIA